MQVSNTQSYTRADGTQVVHYAKRDAQEHHVIPRELRNHPMVTSSKYDIEGEGNLIFLPTGRSGMGSNPEGHSIHLGSHPRYTEELKYKLDDAYQKAIDKTYTQEQQLQQVQDIALEFQSKLTQRDEHGDAFRMNARQDRWDQSLAASSSHNQGNAESATYSPTEGVELDRTNIIGLDIKDNLEFPFLLRSKSAYRKFKQLAHEIDCMIRKRETPWLSLTNIQNRYMVVESSCHDTYIAEAFLKLDYAMKMHASTASLYLPYDLITERRVQKQCEIFFAVELGQMSLKEAIRELKNIGFVDVDTDNALWQKSYNDKKHYAENWHAEGRSETLVWSSLTVRSKLIGLKQDREGRLFPSVKTYIESVVAYSNGEYSRETSDDTQCLKSILQYLQSQRHLKEAFATVWAVAFLFPIIEHLIREGKKIQICDVCLADSRPPKTPRRVPTAIRYGYEVRKPDKFMINVHGGVQLSHKEIKIEKVNAVQEVINPSKSLVWLGVFNQSEEEREMYASAISNLKEPRADVYNSVDPAFIQVVLHERSRPKSANDFKGEYLKVKPATRKKTEKQKKKSANDFGAEYLKVKPATRKEPEKQKKNSCCVVM